VRSRARGRSRIICTETRVRIAPTNQRALLIYVGICPRNHPLPHALIGPGKPGIMYGVHLYIARSTLIIAEDRTQMELFGRRNGWWGKIERW
jgi:hypothetical protein